jgi:formylglycine-generating enzyme required for sulfatase activity
VWPKVPKGLPLTKVGSYPANEFGLFDIRGNAWEWCSDWFAWDYYTKSPEADPQGPETGALRVVRGADWRFTGMGCHYPRYHTESWQVNPFMGFRVACEYPAPQLA